MLKSKLHLILMLSALLAAGLCSDAWLSARHDAAKLAATLASQNATLQHASEAEKRSDAQLASALATIEKQKSAVRTPRQAAAAIPSVLPALPLPVTIQFANLALALPPAVPASSDPDANSIDVAKGDSTTPHGISGEAKPNSKDTGTAEATLHIPQLDLKPLYDGLQDCRENLAKFHTLEQDLADEKARSAALAKERDAAIAAARGGTFWTRVRREAKWFAIGVAAGAVAASVARAGVRPH